MTSRVRLVALTITLFHVMMLTIPPFPDLR